MSTSTKYAFRFYWYRDLRSYGEGCVEFFAGGPKELLARVRECLKESKGRYRCVSVKLKKGSWRSFDWSHVDVKEKWHALWNMKYSERIWRRMKSTSKYRQLERVTPWRKLSERVGKWRDGVTKS